MSEPQRKIKSSRDILIFRAREYARKRYSAKRLDIDMEEPSDGLCAVCGSLLRVPLELERNVCGTCMLDVPGMGHDA